MLKEAVGTVVRGFVTLPMLRLRLLPGLMFDLSTILIEEADAIEHSDRKGGFRIQLDSLLRFIWVGKAILIKESLASLFIVTNHMLKVLMLPMLASAALSPLLIMVAGTLVMLMVV